MQVNIQTKKFKIISVYTCTYVSLYFDHYSSDKFHDHLRVYKFHKFVSMKNYNDWIIDCNLTKFHHSISVRRGFLEILFLPKFQDSWKYSFCKSFRKKISYKSAMIILSYQ